MCDLLRIELPDGDFLTPGCKIRLHRFDNRTWTIGFGWYSFGGNRPFCGWYMTSDDDLKECRPLQKPDLVDIYLIKHERR